MSRAFLGVTLAGLVMGTSCGSLTASDCHREMTDRFGCCPTCDADCRSAITQACADVHEDPLAPIEDADDDPSDEPEPSDEDRLDPQ